MARPRGRLRRRGRPRRTALGPRRRAARHRSHPRPGHRQSRPRRPRRPAAVPRRPPMHAAIQAARRRQPRPHTRREHHAPEACRTPAPEGSHDPTPASLRTRPAGNDDRRRHGTTTHHDTGASPAPGPARRPPGRPTGRAATSSAPGTPGPSSGTAAPPAAPPTPRREQGISAQIITRAPHAAARQGGRPLSSPTSPARSPPPGSRSPGPAPKGSPHRDGDRTASPTSPTSPPAGRSSARCGSPPSPAATGYSSGHGPPGTPTTRHPARPGPGRAFRLYNGDGPSTRPAAPPPQPATSPSPNGNATCYPASLHEHRTPPEDARGPHVRGRPPRLLEGPGSARRRRKLRLVHRVIRRRYERETQAHPAAHYQLYLAEAGRQAAKADPSTEAPE